MRYEQSRVQVELLGETFTIKGADSIEEVETTAVYLSEKLNQMKERFPMLNPKGQAILTALELTEELLRLRKDYEAMTALLDRADGEKPRM